jgi:serine/threonine-protein kinase RsbW
VISFNSFNSRSTPRGAFQANDLNFNRLRKAVIWHTSCLIQGMARKSQVEFEHNAQHTLSRVRSMSRFHPVVELRQSFPSQVKAIEPCVEQLMCFISKFRNQDGSEADIETAVHEALANAIVHGNREDPDKRVYVVCCCDLDGEVSITISDQGQGFDSRAVPDPTAPENQMAAHGRGIYLMRASMDEVRFDEGGAVVRMRKKPNADPTATEQLSQLRRNEK